MKYKMGNMKTGSNSFSRVNKEQIHCGSAEWSQAKCIFSLFSIIPVIVWSFCYYNISNSTGMNMEHSNIRNLLFVFILNGNGNEAAE